MMSSVLCLQAFDRFNERENLLESRHQEIQFLVENATSLVQSFYDRRHIIGEQEAQEQAINLIKNLRYDDGNGYFWINDYDANIIMHPIKPDLDGKDMSSFADPNGKRLFFEFAKKVRTSEKGIVDYYWAKPGEDHPVPKSSYVQGFKPWNFIIGTGVYIDDINSDFWSKSQKNIVSLILILGVVIVIARAITQDTVRPLNKIVLAMQEAAKGNFTSKVDIAERKDEIGALNLSFKSMQNSFTDLINHNLTSSEKLSNLAKVMSDITTATKVGVDQQHSETETLASAIEELATTIQEVANNAAETSDLTQEAESQINLGNDMMSNTIQAINNVAEDMNQAGQVISKLELDVKQIDTILNVIRNISEQTNLLALNAAIEAARAGESGRGFAVVADEVRSLAQLTHESTEEIQAMTEGLQSGASNAVRVMSKGKENTLACVDNARTTGDCLSLAGAKVSEVNDRNNQIATTVEQQGIVANEVSKNVLSIKDVAQETFLGAQTLANCSQELKSLTDVTRNLLVKYKV